MSNINWEALREGFLKDLCGFHYSRHEINTDNADIVFEWFKTKINQQLQVRKINDLERSKGRSENYYALTAEQQWAEDKRLGLLDWDGN